MKRLNYLNIRINLLILIIPNDVFIDYSEKIMGALKQSYLIIIIKLMSTEM